MGEFTKAFKCRTKFYPVYRGSIDVGTIIGAVIGAVATIAAALIAVYCVKQSRQRNQRESVRLEPGFRGTGVDRPGTDWM
jgi:hypothetical protein